MPADDAIRRRHRFVDLLFEIGGLAGQRRHRSLQIRKGELYGFDSYPLLVQNKGDLVGSADTESPADISWKRNLIFVADRRDDFGH